MKILAAVICFLLLPLTAVAQDHPQPQTSEDIVGSFKAFVDDYFKKAYTDSTDYAVVALLPTHTWMKMYFVRSGDYSIDVRKTDSLVSPYVGVLEFPIEKYSTTAHKTEEDAKADNNFFPPVPAPRQRKNFALQDNKWIQKSEQYSVADEWADCRSLATILAGLFTSGCVP